MTMPKNALAGMSKYCAFSMFGGNGITHDLIGLSCPPRYLHLCFAQSIVSVIRDALRRLRAVAIRRSHCAPLSSLGILIVVLGLAISERSLFL